MSSPPLRLLAIAKAYRRSQLLYVAAKLGIADLLATGTRTCNELAESLNASPDALCRVMRGLSVIGVFTPEADGRFALNEMSEPLLEASKDSIRPGIIYLGEEQYRAWGDLLQTVMTGEPAFRRMFGDPFEYYDEHPDSGGSFDDWMAVASRQLAAGIAGGYEFPETGTVVDVAGGEGILLAAVLKPRPALRGVLFDRASVIEKARRVLDEEGVLDRCRLVAGDFRREVPDGGDLYILKNILHDWDDSAAIEILGACRRAMRGEARLLVIQRAMPVEPADAPYLRSLVDSDLMQLVYSGGRERTEAEFRDLFLAAGLEPRMTTQSQGVAWLMEVGPGR